LTVIDAEQRAVLKRRAIAGGFWFATALAVVWLIVDLVFYFTGSLTTSLLIWGIIRTVLLPVLGYLLGWLGGAVALRRVLTPKSNGNGGNATDGRRNRLSRRRQLEVLST